MDMVQVGCEEMGGADDEARMEHERGERERERAEIAEAWARLEAVHGPLMTADEWVRHSLDYNAYMAQIWKD